MGDDPSSLPQKVRSQQRASQALTAGGGLPKIMSPWAQQGWVNNVKLCLLKGERVATKMIRTYSPKVGEIERRWYIVDVAGKTLGRISTEIARVLTGKNKPQYAPHIDTGDFVVVVNAEKTVLTGNKEQAKMYYRHSTHPGGLKEENAASLRERFPERLIERSVKGMLPKNKLGRAQLKKLKVYAGPDHPHAAQQPETLPLVS